MDVADFTIKQWCDNNNLFYPTVTNTEIFGKAELIEKIKKSPEILLQRQPVLNILR